MKSFLLPDKHTLSISTTNHTHHHPQTFFICVLIIVMHHTPYIIYFIVSVVLYTFSFQARGVSSLLRIYQTKLDTTFTHRKVFFLYSSPSCGGQTNKTRLKKRRFTCPRCFPLALYIASPSHISVLTDSHIHLFFDFFRKRESRNKNRCVIYNIFFFFLIWHISRIS